MTSHRYSPGPTSQFSLTPSWRPVGVGPGPRIVSLAGPGETRGLGGLLLVEVGEGEVEQSSSLTSDL